MRWQPAVRQAAATCEGTAATNTSRELVLRHAVATLASPHVGCGARSKSHGTTTLWRATQAAVDERGAQAEPVACVLRIFPTFHAFSDEGERATVATLQHETHPSFLMCV